jgi:hypothetical protein
MDPRPETGKVWMQIFYNAPDFFWPNGNERPGTTTVADIAVSRHHFFLDKPSANVLSIDNLNVKAH